MNRYVIDPPPVVSIGITASAERFPVRRVYCVGRNYSAHVLEMNPQADVRDPPFFFHKPADAIVETGETVPYPPETADLHHEVELVVAIGQEGAGIGEADALAHVWGYGVGVDLTRRDLQAVAKSKGWPWEMGKAFDHGAPMGALSPASEVGHGARGLTLRLNGSVRQTGSTAQMTWSVPEIIARLSAHYRLFPGDLIMTGTPEGVGPVAIGDVIEAEAEGLAALRVQMGPVEQF